LIERLNQTHVPAFGFKIIGKLAAADIEQMCTAIDEAVRSHQKPIGLLLDFTQAHGAAWTARWEEMRFLQRHTDRIARLAIVSDDDWQEIAQMVLVAAAVLQGETLYFTSSELHHAWHWVKLFKREEQMPVRVMYPGTGLFRDYTPEYMGV
jgi:hypothetical protein